MKLSPFALLVLLAVPCAAEQIVTYDPLTEYVNRRFNGSGPSYSGDCNACRAGESALVNPDKSAVDGFPVVEWRVVAELLEHATVQEILDREDEELEASDTASDGLGDQGCLGNDAGGIDINPGGSVFLTWPDDRDQRTRPRTWERGAQPTQLCVKPSKCAGGCGVSVSVQGLTSGPAALQYEVEFLVGGASPAQPCGGRVPQIECLRTFRVDAGDCIRTQVSRRNSTTGAAVTDGGAEMCATIIRVAE